jgi:hypothetical protein
MVARQIQAMRFIQWNVAYRALTGANIACTWAASGFFEAMIRETATLS